MNEEHEQQAADLEARPVNGGVSGRVGMSQSHDSPFWVSRLYLCCEVNH